METSLKALEWRYAVKKFDPDRRLEETSLEHLKTAFNLTATSYGLQPIRMLVVRHRELQEQLVKHSYGQRQVADASHILVLCIEKKIDSDYIESYFNRVQEVRGTPGDVLHPFKKSLIDSFKKMTSEEIRIWSAQQAYLAMGNLLTICAYERLDSCPMEGFDPNGYDAVLGLADMGLEAVLVLPVGYRAEDDMFSGLKKVRKPMEDSIITITDI